MTLYANALSTIRIQLQKLANGQRVTAVEIGRFTLLQHDELNELRASEGFSPLIDPTILFVGSHLYKSRVLRDDYTIEDVIDQIASAFGPTSVLTHSRNMTVLRSTVSRADRYGNMVLDEAVFELVQKKPKAELFSVVPKGDNLKIRGQKK